MPNVCKLYVRVYVSKDVMIRGYFSKPKGVREQKDDMIYLLTAIGLPPSGSSKVHIYTQTIHRMTQSKQ